MVYYCSHKFFTSRSLFSLLAISFLIPILSSTKLKFRVEGRPIDLSAKTASEEKASVRAQIGSRPPRCERRCNSCGHCEAIQVPANPQVNVKPKSGNFTIAYSRGDDSSSNYKPMSWKCKCGNFIFNP